MSSAVSSYTAAIEFIKMVDYKDENLACMNEFKAIFEGTTFTMFMDQANEITAKTFIVFHKCSWQYYIFIIFI